MLSAVIISSVSPSLKYSCSGSPLRLLKGSTAIEGLSGNSSPAVGGTGRIYESQIAQVTAPTIKMAVREKAAFFHHLGTARFSSLTALGCLLNLLTNTCQAELSRRSPSISEISSKLREAESTANLNRHLLVSSYAKRLAQVSHSSSEHSYLYFPPFSWGGISSRSKTLKWAALSKSGRR